MRRFLEARQCEGGNRSCFGLGHAGCVVTREGKQGGDGHSRDGGKLNNCSLINVWLFVLSVCGGFLCFVCLV